MLDPYPRKTLLSQKELRVMLSMDRSTWYEFLADQTTRFPRPVIVGRTGNGKARHRWKKMEVLAWHDSLDHDQDPVQDPVQDQPGGPKKKS